MDSRARKSGRSQPGKGEGGQEWEDGKEWEGKMSQQKMVGRWFREMDANEIIHES